MVFKLYNMKALMKGLWDIMQSLKLLQVLSSEVKQILENNLSNAVLLNAVLKEEKINICH